MTRTRPSVRRPLLAGSAVALLALVAACAGADDGASGDASTTAAPPATTSPATTPSPTATPTGDAADADADAAAPAFPADTAADTAEASADAALTVTDVRVGHHDGFDRVVLELGGTGTPGWRVEYVDAAVADPSDEPVELAGDSVLRVIVEGTVLPYDTGLTEAPIGTPLTAAGSTAVAEAVYLGAFEGQSQALVGVTGEPKPFRAYLLQDPVRVVVDVQG